MGSTFLVEADRLGVCEAYQAVFYLLYLVRQVFTPLLEIIFLGGIGYGIQNRH